MERAHERIEEGWSPRLLAHEAVDVPRHFYYPFRVQYSNAKSRSLAMVRLYVAGILQETNG